MNDDTPDFDKIFPGLLKSKKPQTDEEKVQEAFKKLSRRFPSEHKD